MMDLKAIERHLDKLYTDLAELKCALVASAGTENERDSREWEDLFAATEEVSARWTGPDAVEEIRTQREK